MSTNTNLTPSDSKIFNSAAANNNIKLNKNKTITTFNINANDSGQEKILVSSVLGSDDPFGSAPFSLPPALREKAAASLRKTGGGKVYRNFNFLK